MLGLQHGLPRPRWLLRLPSLQKLHPMRVQPRYRSGGLRDGQVLPVEVAPGGRTAQAYFVAAVLSYISQRRTRPFL